MKKVLLIGLAILTFYVGNSTAQHYIGLDKDETKKMAREAGFYPDHLTTSQIFNYLKFVNSANTKTLIVFFSEDDISTGYKIVCDYTEYDFVLKKNDEKYTKTGKNKWEYKKGNEIFEVLLDEQDWYFVLRVKKKQV